MNFQEHKEESGSYHEYIPNLCSESVFSRCLVERRDHSDVLEFKKMDRNERQGQFLGLEGPYLTLFAL
jgi:hypothetical protein